MSRLGLVIFGATGFTGKKAVEETARIAKSAKLTWGIAGRSKKKLDDVIAEAAKNTGEDLSNVKIIIADINNELSLLAMCAQASVIVNCCGPYRLYGEPVIKACVEAKTHHVDISGEPQFIEGIQLKYDKLARESGVYVISACGFDSIPNDMGVVFMQQNFEGTLNSVESYLTATFPSEHWWSALTHGSIHYGTWDSLVRSISSWSELPALRKKLYPQPLPPFDPKLKSRSLMHRHGGGWCLPFPGADLAIVYRTQRYLYEVHNQRPTQFRPYIQLHSLLLTLAVFFSSALLFLLSKTSFTRNLLLNYPRIFSLGAVSHSGPKEEVMNNTTFMFELIGRGWTRGVQPNDTPDKKITVQVRGVNPGYGATVTALMWSAITILQQKEKMPSTGGVYTTGIAFKQTDLIKRLNENNLTFTVVKVE